MEPGSLASRKQAPYRTDLSGVSATVTPPLAGDADAQKTKNAEVPTVKELAFHPRSVVPTKRAAFPLRTFGRIGTASTSHIADYLTLKDAVALMLSSRHAAAGVTFSPELVRALQGLEVALVLPLGDVERRLNALTSAGEQLMRSIAAGVMPPGAGFLPAAFMAYLMPQMVESAIHRAGTALRLLDGGNPATQVQRAGLQREVYAKVFQVEDIVFHYTQRDLDPASAMTRQATSAVEPQLQDFMLQEALLAGRPDILRASLQELLAVPRELLPDGWVAAAFSDWRGESVLADMCTRSCGALDAEELQQYEAIAACIGEISRCNTMTLAEMDDCIRPRSTDLIGGALEAHNPPAAASVLLGICESSAPTAVKHSLLGGEHWNAPHEVARVERLITKLDELSWRAPEWIAQVQQRLEAVKAGLA